MMSVQKIIENRPCLKTHTQFFSKLEGNCPLLPEGGQVDRQTEAIKEKWRPTFDADYAVLYLAFAMSHTSLII